MRLSALCKLQRKSISDYSIDHIPSTGYLGLTPNPPLYLSEYVFVCNNELERGAVWNVSRIKYQE